MDEIQLNTFDTETGSGNESSVLEPVQPKIQPPMVPPKPSKSKLSLPSFPESDQSSVTDGLLPEYNLDFPNPLQPNGSGNQNQNPFPDETGDWSRSLKLSLIESEHIDEFSNPTNDKSQDAIISLDQSANGCPFYELHHKTPCEFLSLPSFSQIADEDKNILLGIDDFPSNVDLKIKFIVRNLENCGGVWPMMFLEKLNRLIVSADFNAVQDCFLNEDEELSLVEKLVHLYRNTKRCNLVFRYWCTFYNILARNLVPFLSLAESGILELLQRDFVLAANAECHCSKNSSKSTDDGVCKLAEEHNRLSPKVRLEIISILMIPLFTAQASLKPNTNYELLDTASESLFTSTALKIISATDIPALNQEQLLSEVAESSKERDNSQLKEILVHLLLAYNLQYPIRSPENPLVKGISEEEFDNTVVFKTKLINIFAQEYRLLLAGCLDGIGSLIPQAPLGFQTVGVNGPLKLLINILSLDPDKSKSFFSHDELMLLSEILSGISTRLSQVVDEKTEEIYSNCRIVQECLELKLGFYSTEIDLGTAPTSELDGSRSSNDSQANLTGLNGTDEALSLGKDGLICSNRKAKNDPLLKFKDIRFAIWPVEILMKCFGCSKRKATVAPATMDDLDYF